MRNTIRIIRSNRRTSQHTIAVARVLFAVAVLAILSSSAVAAANAPTVIIVVRHADKASADSAPTDEMLGLSPPGRKRAEALANVVQRINTLMGAPGVAAIFATRHKRTQATAQPLATRLQLTPILIAMAKTNDLITAVQTKIQNQPGKIVVIVGHTNTVPTIVKSLSDVFIGAIPESQFDNLFLVTISAPNQKQVLALRYGDRSP